MNSVSKLGRDSDFTGTWVHATVTTSTSPVALFSISDGDERNLIFVYIGSVHAMQWWKQKRNTYSLWLQYLITKPSSLFTIENATPTLPTKEHFLLGLWSEKNGILLNKGSVTRMWKNFHKSFVLCSKIWGVNFRKTYMQCL